MADTFKSGSFITNSTTYNNYSQCVIINWTSRQDENTNKHYINVTADLDKGYAVIYPTSTLKVNGVTVESITSNTNVSNPNNDKYTRKHVFNKTNIEVPADSNGNAKVKIEVVVHIAASNLNASGSKEWQLPQLIPSKDIIPLINTFECEDTNQTTLNLTGNKNRLVVGYSKVKVTVDTAGQRGASISKCTVTNGNVSKVLNATSGSVVFNANEITINLFTLTVEDNQGHKSTANYAMVDVGYNKIGLNVTYDRPSQVGDLINFALTGSIFSKTFGSLSNSLRYTYSIDGGPVTNVTGLNFSNGKFELNESLSGLDYQSEHTVVFIVYDKLSSASFTVEVMRGVPDFAHNKNRFLLFSKEFYRQDNDKSLVLQPLFKMIKATTPFGTAPTKIYEDTGLHGNYIIVGYNVVLDDVYYMWSDTAVNGIYITPEGISMKLDNADVSNKIIYILLARITTD